MDECNLAKAMSNAGNQMRYDEYLRILKENASEITIKAQPTIELVTKEDVAGEIACQTPYSTLAWLNTLTQLERCGYHICKIKGVKDDAEQIEFAYGTCKDCKHWKDSDGVYRRGIGAESKCPINIKEVYEGNFYCKWFEKRGNENKGVD